MRPNFKLARQMADFTIAIARSKPGGIVPIPDGATQEHLCLAMELAQTMKVQKSRLLYESQADGIY